MDLCLKNNNLLTQITIFLNPIDIISLSRCCKKFKEDLEPLNNPVINTIFLLSIFGNYFEIDEDMNFKNKKNLLGKNINFHTDFKLFLKQLKENFNNYEDKSISERIIDFFKIHIYLPDLRKECFHLEFENNSIHMLISYDINTRLVHTYNFYSKYITVDNIILHPENKGKIKILREKLLFESPLINFTETFRDFVNNNCYCEFVNSEILLYKYEDLYNNYQKIDFHTLKQCNNKDLNAIFNFILWINYMFILYCNINYEYITGLYPDYNEQELLSEYMTKKNDLINTALLINSTFDNINIIINFLSIFKSIFDEYYSSGMLSLSQCSSTDSESNINNKQIDEKKWYNKIISPDKFTIYNLLLKNIEHFYTSKLQAINQKFQKVAKEYFEEVFTVKSPEQINKPKNEPETKDEDSDIIMTNEIKSDDDEDISMDMDDFDEKLTKKELIENYANSSIDRFINPNNSNGIMHSNFKMDVQYINDVENILVNLMHEQVLKSLNVDKMPIDECFDIVDKISRCEGNSKCLYRNKDSLVLIRRTKKRVMKEGYNAIFAKLMNLIFEDFGERIKKDRENLSLSVIEQLNIHDYKCNMDALSEEGEHNVKVCVKKDYEKATSCLIKYFNLNEEEHKLADDYFKCVKIPYVLLFKKLVYNYYKQLEIYKERDEKVLYYLTHQGSKFISECLPDEENINKVNNGDKYIRKDDLLVDYYCDCRKEVQGDFAAS